MLTPFNADVRRHMRLMLEHSIWLSLLTSISVCAFDGQRTDRATTESGSPPAAFADAIVRTGGPETFVASEPPITPAQWQRIFDEVKMTPGARINQQGSMLVMISITSSNENSSYLFTQPAHPAHPAYLKAFSTSPSGRPVTIVGNYAGSKTEFENLARSFIAFINKK